MEKRFSAPIKRRAQEPEEMIGPSSSSSVNGQDQSSQNFFKKPLLPPQPSQDEPVDLSLSAEERLRRSRFWAFVERKQKRGEVVLYCAPCLMVFSDPIIYYMHMGTHAWGHSFQCFACGTVCNDRREFQQHLIFAPHNCTSLFAPAPSSAPLQIHIDVISRLDQPYSMIHRLLQLFMEKMSPILLLLLCSTEATLNGFEISLDANALPSVVRPLEDQASNLQPVLYNPVPVLDSSALRVEVPIAPKLTPPINDRPTNGFWPNPQAVRMFLGRNPNQQQPYTGSTAAKGPPVPSILIHQAIHPPVEEAITYPVTPEGTWDIYPGRESVPTLNPIVIEGVPTPGPVVIQPTLKPEIPLQQTLKPEIPLSVLVHLISGGMGEGSGEDVDETTTPRTIDEELPSFLIGVPDDVIQDYFKIKNNQELTKGEVKTSLEQLKLKLPPDSLRNYEKLQFENEHLLEMERSRQTERITSMGEMAKQVAEQIQEVRANDSLTQTEEEVLVQEMVDTVSQELRDGLRMI